MNPYIVRFNAPSGAHDDVDVELAAADGFAAIHQARDENPDLRSWRVSAVCLAPREAGSCPVTR